MGKKKEEEMAWLKVAFLEGAEEKEVNPELAKYVFDLMARFAGYGFNKSHSACYALITLQAAYLKCHHPEEFMAAVLTCHRDNTDNLTKHIAETRAMGIQVVRPDVNESESEFSVVESEGEKLIRFGLTAVRNVGEGAVENIIEARQEATFTGLYDFCERVDTRKVNRRVVEALIKSGAFDGLAGPRRLSRARLMAALDVAHGRAVKSQRDRESGQTNLFGMLEGGDGGGVVAEGEARKYPEIPDWGPMTRLSFEKENLGFYVSGHPLDRYESDLKRYTSTTITEINDRAVKGQISGGWGRLQQSRVGGMIGVYREWALKNGTGRMASFVLEDRSSSLKVVAFKDTFVKCEKVLKSGEPLLISGRLRVEGEDENQVPEMVMDSAVTLANLRVRETSEMCLCVDGEAVKPEQIAELKAVLIQHTGECRTHLKVTLPRHTRTLLMLSERYSVNPCGELLVKLKRMFGNGDAALC